VKVARYYCAKGQTTFSLLPDCLASRYPAELWEMEEAVEGAEQTPSREQAVAHQWPEIELPGALRKLRRWTLAVTVTLTLARGLLPELEVEHTNLEAFRARLGERPVLMALREKLSDQLHVLPPPLGFGPRPRARPRRATAVQHQVGPDPPE
jgi:hypothetical protein